MPEINRETWDSFVLSQNGSFLQSWAWGDFQRLAGKKVIFLKGNDWQALVLVTPLRFGKTYFYIPHGPVWNKQKNNEQIILKNFLNKIESIANDHNAIFLLIEPKTSEEKNIAVLKEIGLKKNEKSIQPEDTLIVDISRPENEILESFEKRCRSEIRLADKKNVQLYSDTTETGIKIFLELLKKTAKRDSFRTHPLAYYETMVKTLKNTGQADLFFAKLGQDIISGCIIVYFGDTASYVHAASDGPYRAANALVWTAMKEAKKKQCKYFDLYGIAPANADEKHPWHGLTKFKESFGGARSHYIGAYDRPISKFWYELYKIGKKTLK
jgi:lipid II:glycine glycyltransferase (peptidoglycan interpeptide bridge formation enzyme)